MSDRELSKTLAQEAPPGTTIPTRRSWPWRRLVLITFLMGIVLGGIAWSNWWSPSVPGRLQGELTVSVGLPGGQHEMNPVQHPGSLPVRRGQWMTLQVQLNQPAYVYLVWLNPRGQVIPLYPWNQDGLVVKDLNEAPPRRSATRVLINPSMGTGWKFEDTSGLETVLLLANRTPLDPDLQLGTRLETLPPARLRLPDEVAILALDRGGPEIATLEDRNRGTEAEARAVDQPLLSRLASLRDHFEMIRVIRFAHE